MGSLGDTPKPPTWVGEIYKIHYRVRVRPGLNRYLLSWQESPLPLSYWPNTANRTRIGTNRLEDEWTNHYPMAAFFVRGKYNFLLYNTFLIISKAAPVFFYFKIRREGYFYITLLLSFYFFRVTLYPLQLLPSLIHLLRK